MTVTLFVQMAAKGTLVLLVGLGLTRMMSRASAAARHLVWALTLVAAATVAVIHVAGPAWTLAVLPSASQETDVAPQVTAAPTAAGVPLGAVDEAASEADGRQAAMVWVDDAEAASSDAASFMPVAPAQVLAARRPCPGGALNGCSYRSG